ncbi:MAG: MBL fold metallo-hydrolase [Solirubrobacterales bacterium]|nr:MBL fold metallo-hydrolase [Solirubrobacterales bacterium]MBV9716817.1 MBL fold metallo-hydrolase [Solirubrobacterales bacterium]
MAREVLPDVFEALFPKALVHAFVVRADVPTLVDTGTPGDVARIEAAANAAGLGVDDIRRILVTHPHADHAGNAAELAQRTGAEVHVSPAAAPYVRDGHKQALPRAATPLGRAMVPYVTLALPWRVAPVDARPTLADGAAVGPFRVIDTPGHQIGHVALLWEERGVLFTGDAAANITRVGPHPAAENPTEALASFRRLRDAGFTAALFGHGRALRSHAARSFAD